MARELVVDHDGLSRMLHARTPQHDHAPRHGGPNFPGQAELRRPRAEPIACNKLASCNMRTLYLRNVPDDVVKRLERLAALDSTSVAAVAVRELAEVTRRADNPALLGVLPDLNIDGAAIVEDIAAGRSSR